MRNIVGKWLIAGAVALSAVVPWGASLARAGGRPPSSTSPPAPAPAWQVLVAATSALQLSHPERLAIDQRGQGIQKWLYLVDTGNSRVVKLGTGGHYLGSWGSRGTAPRQFQQPEGIAVDRHGDVYVADTGNNRIQKFDSAGRFLTQWGTAGTAPGQFDDPAGIAVGGSGNVFVADTNDHRIEKFSAAGRLLAVWPVPIPTGPAWARLGPAGPYALAVDTRGNVYVAVHTGLCSGGHCVMDYILLDVFSPAGKLLRSWVGGNPYGGYSYGPIAAFAGQGSWWQIGALTVASQGHVFLAEWNPQDQASVTEITSTAKLIGQWELPQPSGARGWPPQGIAVDPRGNVYVTDTLASRVLKLIFQP